MTLKGACKFVIEYPPWQLGLRLVFHNSCCVIKVCQQLSTVPGAAVRWGSRSSNGENGYEHSKDCSNL
jgi:hypothetical protein